MLKYAIVNKISDVVYYILTAKKMAVGKKSSIFVITGGIQLETEDNPYKKYLAFAIEDKTSHLVIGSVGSTYYEDFEEVGVTYFIGADYRGNGYAAEALHCLVNYLFVKYNLKKLVATANVLNIASCKTLEGVGFSVVETKPYQDLYDEREEMSNIYELIKN